MLTPSFRDGPKDQASDAQLRTGNAGITDSMLRIAPVANEKTENLIGQAALARMQRHDFFINLSRGDLVERPRCQRHCARTASPAQ
jgi:lactate dehydrogenase-like 2-hydroxyacid dehydrogenase